MNIIFGGSFNPVTKAHILIAKHLVNKYNPERLVFLPVGNDYDKPELVEFKHRYSMLEQVISDRMEVCNYEGVNPYKGTYNTLKNLPYSNMYFVIGSDNLNGIRNWNEFDKLISEYKFIIVSRPNSMLDLSAFKGFEHHVLVVDDLDIEISSSLYRKTKDKSLLEHKTNDYIEKNRLYK